LTPFPCSKLQQGTEANISIIDTFFLVRSYNKEQKQRIAEGRKPFMVKDVTKKGAYKWDKDRVSET
jgi:hypothetical protein